jgi:predicted RNA binding protein YcfA (HicA-like mRNA interferase family)
MASKYPVLTPQEIVRALKKFDFRFVSQNGSHMKYSNGARTTIVPNHDTVAKGTLQSILALAGVELEDFLKKLQ